MYTLVSLVTLLAAASTTQAIHFSHVKTATSNVANVPRTIISGLLGSLFGKQEVESCPAVWSEISTTLTAQFLADGQCTDAARAAIRGAFHDCFNGACDGSLILANECSNPENRGLERLCTQLGGLAKQKNVGTADLIQFAAAHAIKTCPGGPTVPVKVGRKDSSTANPTGVIPTANQGGASLVTLFLSKGFSAIDLAALVGAHTTGRQRVTDPSQANKTFDSTPGIWDNAFYKETIARKAPFTLQSDKNIQTNLLTMAPFASFAASKAAWDLAFVPAMEKMSMLGVKGVKLVDCTSALPGGSAKRDVKSAPLFERFGKW